MRAGVFQLLSVSYKVVFRGRLYGDGYLCGHSALKDSHINGTFPEVVWLPRGWGHRRRRNKVDMRGWNGGGLELHPCRALTNVPSLVTAIFKAVCRQCAHHFFISVHHSVFPAFYRAFIKTPSTQSIHPFGRWFYARDTFYYLRQSVALNTIFLVPVRLLNISIRLTIALSMKWDFNTGYCKKYNSIIITLLYISVYVHTYLL